MKRTVLFRMLLAIAVAAISYLAFTERSIPVVEDVNDKAEHITAFLALAVLVDLSWPLLPFGAVKFLGLLGYGLFIEVVQYFLPHRTASALDLTADAIGIVLYLIAAAPIARRLGLLPGRPHA